MDQAAIFMVGHTAAGKTTLAKALCKELGVIFISQSARKRSLVQGYTANNSLDEELRDRGYAIAISDAESESRNGNPVLIDASFHKLHRRNMIYSNPTLGSLPLVAIHCKCDHRDTVAARIESRRLQPKHADNQADSMDVYDHIIAAFDPIVIEEFPKGASAVVFYIDTYNNRLDRIETNNNTTLVRNITLEINEFIDTYMRELSQSDK